MFQFKNFGISPAKKHKIKNNIISKVLFFIL